MLRRRMMMAKAQEVEEMKEWRLIAKRTISEETSRIDITTDDDGKPFSCSELIIAVNLKADKDEVIPIYLLSGKWTSAYPYINGKKLSASWFDNYVIKARITSGIQMQECIPNNVSKWTTAIETAITSYSIVAQNGNFASGTVYIIGR